MKCSRIKKLSLFNAISFDPLGCQVANLERGLVYKIDKYLLRCIMRYHSRHN